METEVALTLPTNPLPTAYIDLLAQNPETGVVYGVEVKQEKIHNTPLLNYWFIPIFSSENKFLHWTSASADLA